MDRVTLSPQMVADIQEQIARQLRGQVAQIVEEAVTEVLNPQAVARRALRLEEQRYREDSELRARALTAAAPAIKQALVDEALKYGNVQLRFTSVEAPCELQWVPIFPSHAFRR